MRIRLLVAALAASLPALSAEAASLTFEYTGQCSFNCEEEGLVVGAPAFGKVVIDDSGYSPDGFFGNEALLDFSFDLGGIKLDKAGALAFSFGGPWQVVPGGPLLWLLDASTSVNRIDLGPTISAGGLPSEAFVYASKLGTCEVRAWSSCAVAFHTAAQFELNQVAQVPLPPAMLLLMGGLAGLAGVGLRRRGGGAA